MTTDAIVIGVLILFCIGLAIWLRRLRRKGF